MLEYLEKLASGETVKIVAAGAAGGVVRWVTLRNDWREGLSSVIVGALCALYLGPIIEPLLTPLVGSIAPDGDSSGFSSFIVGLGGISLSGMILDMIRAHRQRITNESKDE